ncbi:MAG: septal ring lytic transglycosylase RlpA family lipoprotein [Sulfurospirillum sp.]|nr:MAG: septal ring lytic transglycosylase RlpA family lipoprotein [Sulfurospirillum sp.]
MSGCTTMQNPFVPIDENSYTSQPVIFPVPPQKPITGKNMYRATMKPYCVKGVTYCPTTVYVGEKFRGIASWYGPNFHGTQTSNGEYYDMYGHTAAHKTLPINTMVKVTNLSTGKSTVVRINDRGPFVKNRIIDLSYQAAKEIGVIKHGTANVELEVISFDPSASRYAHKKSLPPPRSSVTDTASPVKNVHEVQQPHPQKALSVVQSGGFNIQIASFSDENKALAFKRKCYNVVKAHPIEIRKKKIATQPIYSILISGFQSIEAAKAYIKRYHYKDAFVVRD